jgi:hypothetical protein
VEQQHKPVSWELAALYRHWCRADAIKYVLFAVIADQPTRDQDVLDAEAISTLLRLEVFYALTFVVVEGYRELELQDPAIDQLLAVPVFVDQLRRFRNGVFHYQADPLSSKLMDLITAKQSQEWMQDLHRAFQRFFLEILPIKTKLDEMGWKSR